MTVGGVRTACTETGRNDRIDSLGLSPTATDDAIPASIPASIPATLPVTARDTANVRVEVDLTSREVRVIRDERDTMATFPLAIGSTEWPTRTGSWIVDQVVLNPEWIPPDESWAEAQDGKQPGDRTNPLGRAQIVYDLPRSNHGTSGCTE